MTEETGNAQKKSELRTGQAVNGTVKKLELYGAFVDIGVGQDALLHISQLGQSNVRNVEDVVKVGDQIEAYILKVHPDTQRIALTLVKPPALSWDEIKMNSVFTGEVVRIETYGVFVDIGAERAGMVHVSELASGFVKSPGDVVKIGDQVEVRVIKLNRKKRQIDLSMKIVEEIVIEEEEDQEEVPTAMALALRRAMANKDDDEEVIVRQSKSAKRRAEQNDILTRTLRQHSSN